MFRFDRLIRRDAIIRDVKHSHPQAIPIPGPFRFRPAYDGCDIDTVARKNGFNSPDVAQALNPAAFGLKADTENHASD
jgi:hypothetical protein